MKRSLIAALALAVLVLNGCAPRGETRTLDEVLSTEKGRYQAARVGTFPEGVGQAVGEVAKNIELALQGRDSKEIGKSLQQVAVNLEGLVDRAGYTSRAAMNEISEQYRALSESKAVSQAQVKLLAARTYSLLAGELTTTKFAVS